MSTSNRYVASCGVILHFNARLYLRLEYIIIYYCWNQSAIAFAFSTCHFCLGMSAAFMGRSCGKFGPRVTGTISAILYASGNICGKTCYCLCIVSFCFIF